MTINHDAFPKEPEDSESERTELSETEKILVYLLSERPPSDDWVNDYTEFLNIYAGIECSSDEVIQALQHLAQQGIVEFKGERYEIVKK